MRRRAPKIGLLVCLVACYVLIGKEEIKNVFHMNAEKKIVVIDPGHGGPDPGKIGINGVLEKDINLAIAGYVKDYLTQNGVTVLLTRQEDSFVGSLEEDGVYGSDISEKYHKINDLKNRIALVEASHAKLVVSIHQNSYPSEVVSGTQVFYYTKSEEGKLAAKLLQNQVSNGLGQEKKRQEKANDSYYLLKKSAVPTVIIECGFLTNQREAELLRDEQYQKKIAWNICIGILQYLSTSPDKQ